MGRGKRTRERAPPKFLDPSKRASGLLCRGGGGGPKPLFGRGVISEVFLASAQPPVLTPAGWKSPLEVFVVLCEKGVSSALEIPTDSCHFFCTPGNPCATPLVTRGEGSFSYQGVSTRGVRHSPVFHPPLFSTPHGVLRTPSSERSSREGPCGGFCSSLSEVKTFISCDRKNPRPLKVSEGFLKGSLKGAWRVLVPVSAEFKPLQNPLHNAFNLVARAIRANRFARIIRNWSPYFYSASGRFARITRISENSRRLWLFLGSLREFWRKVSGNCWKFFPESPNPTNTRISGTGKGKPVGNLGSTLPGPCPHLPSGVFFEIDSSSLLEFFWEFPIESCESIRANHATTLSLVFRISLVSFKQGISLVILVFSLSFPRILWVRQWEKILGKFQGF